MLTLAQIGAILSLLMAFEVPYATIQEVERTLMATRAPAVVTAPIAVVEPIAAPVQLDCAPRFRVNKNSNTTVNYGSFDYPVIATYVSVSNSANVACPTKWAWDIEYDGWERDNANQFKTVKSYTKNWDGIGHQVFIHPLEGTYTASFIARATDNSTSTTPFVITYKGGAVQ